MIDTDDHEQILADPNATTDELRSIIAELQAYYRRCLRINVVAERCRARVNKKSISTATNIKQRWTADHDDMVLTSSLTALELGKTIGRSMTAIHVRRAVLRKRLLTP